MRVVTQQSGRLTTRDYGAGVLAVFLTFAFYLKTLAPTVTWGDPAKLTNFAYTLHLRVQGPYHALRVLIGWLWGHLPFSDYAYGQNLLSAVFASLSVGIVYFVVLKLTASRLAAVLTALALGVSHTFWWLAVIAESYSLLFFLLATCVYAALKWGESRNDWWLFLLAFAFGLGITNHAIMPLFAPAFVLYFLLEDPRFFFKFRRVVGITLAFLFGLSLLIGTFVYSLRWYTAGQLVHQMTAGSLIPYWGGSAKMFKEMVMYLIYLGYQFPGLGLVLGIVGVLVLYRKNRKAFTLLASLFMLDVVFSAGYMYQRQFEILVPSYMVFAFATGMGIAWLWEKFYLSIIKRGVLVAVGLALAGFLILVPVLTYYATPTILRRTGLDPLGARYIPYRDNARYFFLPDKSGYDGAARYGREVLGMLLPDAVILAGFTQGVVLQYLQTFERIRPDVLIVGVEVPGSEGRVALDAVKLHVGRRPIYLTDYCTYPRFFAISELSKKYNFIPQGHIFHLVSKQ